MNMKRLNKLYELMGQNNIKQALISDAGSIYYLTGKWVHPGHRLYAIVIKAGGGNKLFVNRMFPIEEDLGVEIRYFSDTDDAVEILSNDIEGGETLIIDKEWPAKFLLRLMELKPTVKYVNNPLIDDVRRIKNAEEIKLMRGAQAVNEAAMKQLVDGFNPKLTEKALTQKLAGIYEKLGAEGFSFAPILCYGKNTSDPHHVNDESEVKPGDAVIFDIGCILNSYCSDMTRTFFYKSATDKQKEVHSIVLEANNRAIAAVKPGKTFAEIDAAARDFITEKGYGEYFTHRLGHCIGTETHEYGDVSATNLKTLEEGMVFSIEPGIYLPGEFGVRIEDLVVVTKNGCENLNNFSKELRIIE